MTKGLFDELPRRAPVRRMHVAEAGHLPGGQPGIRFECGRCGYDTGWIYDTETVSENRRGLPCPNCNAESPAQRR
jgi:hypothetical protein